MNPPLSIKINLNKPLSLIQRSMAACPLLNAYFLSALHSHLVFLLSVLSIHFPCSAAIIVVDDDDRQVILQKPADKIVSLAPHVTELLFSAGAGGKVVAVVKNSDYPPEAKQIQQVGDAFSIDFERIAALSPDLIVAWKSGNGSATLELLSILSIPVYLSEPRRLEDIAKTINNLGELADTIDVASRNAAHYLSTLKSLRQSNEDKLKLNVFYQTWAQPIFTINHDHLISKVITLCSGTNIFSETASLSPQVSEESVVLKNPEVIFSSGDKHTEQHLLDRWRDWPEVKAVRNHHLYFIPSELIARGSPRILEGANILCDHLDEARNRR